MSSCRSRSPACSTSSQESLSSFFGSLPYSSVRAAAWSRSSGAPPIASVAPGPTPTFAADDPPSLRRCSARRDARRRPNSTPGAMGEGEWSFNRSWRLRRREEEGILRDLEGGVYETVRTPASRPVYRGRAGGPCPPPKSEVRFSHKGGPL